MVQYSAPFFEVPNKRDLSQDTLLRIVQKYTTSEFAALMMKRNPALVANEKLLLSAVDTNQVTKFVRVCQLGESPIEKEKLFTQELLIAAASRSDS